MSSSNCCFLTCIQISQEAGQVVWYSHLLKNFSQFVVIHTVKGFGIVNVSNYYYNFPYVAIFLNRVFLEDCLSLKISENPWRNSQRNKTDFYFHPKNNGVRGNMRIGGLPAPSSYSQGLEWSGVSNRSHWILTSIRDSCEVSNVTLIKTISIRCQSFYGFFAASIVRQHLRGECPHN